MSHHTRMVCSTKSEMLKQRILWRLHTQGGGGGVASHPIHRPWISPVTFDNGHLTIESFISSLAHLVVNFSSFTLSVNCIKVRPNGTFSHFVRQNGIRPKGIRPKGIRQSRKTPLYMGCFVRAKSPEGNPVCTMFTQGYL